MAKSQSTSLHVAPREPSGSRSVRRLRRQGQVPGVVYGGGEDPVAFQVHARDLRIALADAGAVLDLEVEGTGATPVVVKVHDRHPVTGATMHIDLLRVRLDVKIQSMVQLELVGAENSPGVIDNGTLEHITRELTIEALPNDIPDSIQHDVSEMQIGDTLTLDELQPPSGVVLLDDPETIIASLTPPRLQTEGEDEIESETEVVGEGDEAAAEGEEGSAEGGDSGSDAE